MTKVREETHHHRSHSVGERGLTGGSKDYTENPTVRLRGGKSGGLRRVWPGGATVDMGRYVRTWSSSSQVGGRWELREHGRRGRLKGGPIKKEWELQWGIYTEGPLRETSGGRGSTGETIREGTEGSSIASPIFTAKTHLRQGGRGCDLISRCFHPSLLQTK